MLELSASGVVVKSLLWCFKSLIQAFHWILSTIGKIKKHKKYISSFSLRAIFLDC